MRFLALACDYDGTLATTGRVGPSTLAALERLRATGRKILMVTGRELDDLQRTFDAFELFDLIVAENGALLYWPSTRKEKLLADPPSPEFIHTLRERHVGPMSVGRAIVATWKPHETKVLEAIRDLGLDLQVIFNKDAVMVLPAGVNKASGLAAALCELELSAHEVIGIGDAENDLAFLGMCECGVAVDNALPAVKERADLVCRLDHGPGVEELIERVLASDLSDVPLARHDLVLGTRADGGKEKLPPFGANVLIAGPSGSGKSTVAMSVLERLHEHRYQYCIIDPEGDYESIEGAVTLGNNKNAPSVDEVVQVLRKPEASAVVNLVGLPLADRPSYFLSLLPRLQELRARTVRPHWIIVDEAHHLLPSAWLPGPTMMSSEPDRMLFITVHPELMSPRLLKTVDTIVAVGPDPAATIGSFAAAIGEQMPSLGSVAEDNKQVVVWQRGRGQPVGVEVTKSRQEHRRHVKKYAEGELPPDRSFYFRGPDKKLNLRAQNLFLFNQIAEGVDDATWTHHLQQGDYSRWFREGIKDERLAELAESIEKSSASPADSRARMRGAIERFYTLPSSGHLPMPGTS